MNAAFEFPASASALQRLTENQQLAVWRAAGPLYREDREAFFTEIVRKLNGREIGAGLLHRIVAQVQQRFDKAVSMAEVEPPSTKWDGMKQPTQTVNLNKLLAAWLHDGRV